MERELIKTIVIKDYPDKVQISQYRRAIPYLSSTSLLKGKKKIPQRYKNPARYYFDEKGVLISKKTGKAQLANPKTAGKPRFWVVNLQDIWNQNLTKQGRAAKIEKLKGLLRPYVKEIRSITEFPLKLEIFLYDVNCTVDISNRGAVYTKVIEDLLVNTNKGEDDNKKIITDDSIEYLNDSGRCKFIKIKEKSERRMEIRIFKSDNLDY